MEGATNLSDLIGDGPVQNPSLPQGTTFAPIVTGGVDPFINPMMNSPSQSAVASYSNSVNTFSTIKYAVKNFMFYLAFFVSAMVISLSTPRSLILQYIPNTYTSGGVPSYLGAAILGGVAVAGAYVLGTLGSALI